MVGVDCTRGHRAATVIPVVVLVALLIHAWRNDVSATYIKVGMVILLYSGLHARFLWRCSKDQPAMFWSVGVSDNSAANHKEQVNNAALFTGFLLAFFVVLFPLFI